MSVEPQLIGIFVKEIPFNIFDAHLVLSSITLINSSKSFIIVELFSSLYSMIFSSSDKFLLSSILNSFLFNSFVFL
jgi:hypothetical protein